MGVVLGATAVCTVTGVALAGGGGWGELARGAFATGPSWPGIGASVGRGLADSTLNPWYWGFVALLTFAQWRWPARRDERALSVDVAVDAVWFVMGNALQLTVVAVTLGAASVAYTRLVGTWSLHLQGVLGTWGLALVAFVLTDFLAWVTHWCHHKVPTLWRFHAVHHSQRRLNALADNRTHVGEVVAAALIVFVPSQVLGLDAAAATGLAFVGIYYSAMLHANIRTDLGPLRHVFMGPQPHRVHHSVLPRHFEHNFGTVFSWWDRAAGTLYTARHEYPPTGITDDAFPLRADGDRNPWRWLVIFVRQLAYPFQAVLAGFTSRPGRAAGAGAAPPGAGLWSPRPAGLLPSTRAWAGGDLWRAVVHPYDPPRRAGSGAAPSVR
ncbi:MAG TPA: sterol desaturase family protein [Acidimicrobiales bacterium]|nr:sterol desaturase family protein [Acidimicrobiales bacterium]